MGRLLDMIDGLLRQPRARGCSSMVERKPSKLDVRVRFPSPAPLSRPCSSAVEHSLGKGEVAGSSPAMGTAFSCLGHSRTIRESAARSDIGSGIGADVVGGGSITGTANSIAERGSDSLGESATPTAARKVLSRLSVMTMAAMTAAAMMSLAASPAFAEQSGGALDDVQETWCLDAESNEIYTIRNGSREILSVEGIASGSEEMAQVFDEDLIEALDGADALSASLIANMWETGIELIYGPDAFGQRVEFVGEATENEAGDQCHILKAPGFSTMFQAFQDS